MFLEIYSTCNMCCFWFEFVISYTVFIVYMLFSAINLLWFKSTCAGLVYLLLTVVIFKYSITITPNLQYFGCKFISCTILPLFLCKLQLPGADGFLRHIVIIGPQCFVIDFLWIRSIIAVYITITKKSTVPLCCDRFGL